MPIEIEGLQSPEPYEDVIIVGKASPDVLTAHIVVRTLSLPPTELFNDTITVDHTSDSSVWSASFPSPGEGMLPCGGSLAVDVSGGPVPGVPVFGIFSVECKPEPSRPPWCVWPDWLPRPPVDQCTTFGVAYVWLLQIGLFLLIWGIGAESGALRNAGSVLIVSGLTARYLWAQCLCMVSECRRWRVALWVAQRVALAGVLITLWYTSLEAGLATALVAGGAGLYTYHLRRLFCRIPGILTPTSQMPL